MLPRTVKRLGRAKRAENPAEEIMSFVLRAKLGASCRVQVPAGRGATRRPRPLRGEWRAEIGIVGGMS